LYRDIKPKIYLEFLLFLAKRHSKRAIFNLENGRDKCLDLRNRRYTPRPLGRPRRRWDDNIKMDLQEVGWGINWIELAQDRDRLRALVNAVTNLRVS
jgi:hypothetical protein